MIILVTGGAASGKSEFAELKIVGLANSLKEEGRDVKLYYIATMPSFGDENRERIEKHKKARLGRGFETVEKQEGLENLLLPKGDGVCVLLEDIGNLVANEMFGSGGIDGAAERIIGGISALSSQCDHLVIVTNDVSRDGVEYEGETSEYIRIIETVGREISSMCHHVYEVVAGIPVLVK